MATKALLAQIRATQKPEDPSTVFIVVGKRRLNVDSEISLMRICYDYIVSNIDHVNCETLVPDLKLDLLNYLASKRQLSNKALEQLCCPIVESITLYDNPSLTDFGLESIARNCPNLKYIKFSGCHQITSHGIRNLLLSCPKITTLAISLSKFNDSDIVNLLFPNIESLNLRVCKELSGDFVLALPDIATNLTCFDIRWSNNILDKHVIEVASRCHNVHTFDLGLCNEITDESLLAIGKYVGPRLKKLDLETCFRITDLGVTCILTLCKNMDYLSIKNCELVTDSAIEKIFNLKILNISGLVHTSDATIQLIGRKCENLQELHLMGCGKLTDGTVLGLVKSCRDLTILETQNCPLVSQEVRKSVKEMLTERINCK